MRIHAMTGLGQSHVVPAVVRYQDDNPEVSVDLTLAQRMPNLVEEGYDVSIVTAAQLPDSGYVAQTCGESCSVLVASRDYLARHGTPKTPDDLLKHVCLRLDTPSSPGGEWRLERNDGEEQHFDLPPSPFQVNVPDALAVALRSGRGIGSIALYTAIDDLRSGRLVRVLPNYRLHTIHVYAVLRLASLPRRQDADLPRPPAHHPDAGARPRPGRTGAPGQPRRDGRLRNAAARVQCVIDRNR